MRVADVDSSVAPIVVAQFASMAILAALIGTWQDEEYTLATTAHGVAYALHRSISFELQAPLYFVLVAALRSFNSSMFFARMLSVVAACALSFVAAVIARRVWPQRSPRAFTLLVAFNPFVVYAAVEIRLYALALLVSAGLWLTFDAGYLRGELPSARWATIALAIAALYLQYFLSFELLAFAIGLLVARRGRVLVAYLIGMLPVALAFLPLALNLRSQIGGAFGVAGSRPGGFTSNLLHPFVDFILPLAYESIAGPLRHVTTSVLVVLVTALFVAGRPRLDARTASIVAIALCIEALYLIVALLLHYQLSTPRHFVALFVPEVVAVYALVATFRAPWAARCSAALAVVLMLATAVSLGVNYRVLAKQGDWPRVGAMLSKATRAGDAIAVFRADGILPLTRYYHGTARIVPFPRSLPPDHYEVNALFVHSQKEALNALRRLPQNGSLWFVNVGTCDRFDAYGCLELRAALAARYTILERREFFGNEVMRLAPLGWKPRAVYSGKLSLRASGGQSSE